MELRKGGGTEDLRECCPPSPFELSRSCPAWRNKKVRRWRALRDFIASFRNLCLDLPVEMRLVFERIDTLKHLFAA